MSDSQKTDRRQFFTGLFRNASLTLCGGLAWGHLVGQARGAEFSLRPPGAIAEDDFLATCIKCGQCVEACPFDTLKLATAGEDACIGVPYFKPREIPCYMCPDVPCAKACPSGALVQETEIDGSKMGLAVLLDQESCVAFQGLRCEVCYRVCPKLDKAISLDYRPQDRTGKHAFFLPRVHSEECTGCGMCEHACILEKSAIKVLPVQLAQGKMGENYRLGWNEEAVISRDFGPDDARQADVPESVKKRRAKKVLDAMDDLERILEP
jgi:ferredoxin-type protein NapG